MQQLKRSIYFLAIVFFWLIVLHRANSHRPNECLSLIYCRGKLLDTIQRSGLFMDSKTFVDMPTKKPEAEVIK